MADDRKKVSLEQLTLLIDEIERDPSLLSSKGSARIEKVLYVEKWEALAKKLNSVENGALKNVTKWQQAWRDWKSNTRRKANRAGDNCNLELSSLEMRLINMFNTEPPDKNSGSIDISSITEIDPLSSDDSREEQNGQVSVYSRVNSDNANPVEPEDDGVAVKRRKVHLFPDDSTKRQTDILSRLTALEEGRQNLEARQQRVLETLVAALERQADAVARQTDAIARMAEAVQRRAEADASSSNTDL